MEDWGWQEGAIAALAATSTLLLATVVLLWVRVRNLVRAQRVVLGGKHGSVDLVAHAEATQARVDEQEANIGRLVERINRIDRRVHGALVHRGLVRYDAFGDQAGLQSASLALVDGNGTGLVLSSIVGREHDRLYVKEVADGAGTTVALSPEEQAAVRAALEGV